MIDHQQHQLRNLVERLHKIFSFHPCVLPPRANAVSNYSDLLNALCKIKELVQPTTSSLPVESIVCLAYRFRAQAELTNFEFSDIAPDNSFGKVLKTMFCLAQFITGFLVIMMAAKNISLFRNLKIRCVDGDFGGQRFLAQKEWRLGNAFSLLKQDLMDYALSTPSVILKQNINDFRADESTFNAILGPIIGKDENNTRWTEKRVKRKFLASRKQNPKAIHAEVKIILYVSSYWHSNRKKPSGYIGCSKLSCSMCHEFMSILRKVDSSLNYETRGCHGTLHSNCSFPRANGFSGEMFSRVTRDLQKKLLDVMFTHRDLRECLQKEKQSRPWEWLHADENFNINPCQILSKDRHSAVSGAGSITMTDHSISLNSASTTISIA